MATQMHSKKSINKKKFLRVALYTLVLGGAVGSITGTYAWYSYQKSASVDFTGTSIANSELIQIGLRVDHRLNTPADRRAELGDKNFEEYYEADFKIGQMTYEQVKLNDQNIIVYWVRTNYMADVLRSFAYSIGSGVERLPAITTGYYKEGMEWDLGNRQAQEKWSGFKETPTDEGRDFSEFATLKDYFYLPLAFRVYGGAEFKDALPDRSIYLTKFDSVDASAVVGGAYNLKDSVRCKVDYPEITNHSKDFVFDPNSNQDNELKVAGGLNIQRDAYIDNETVNNKIYEKAYGEFNGSPIYEGPWHEDPVIPMSDCTTFVANHKKNAYVVSDSNARTCQTRSNKIVDPLMSGDPIVKTNQDAIGFLDFSIYLEGWDHNVVDQTLNHTFSISIEFTID